MTALTPPYRGCGDRTRLPPQLKYPDEFCAKGGCEIGFMSTTSNRAVARQYCNEGVILEIQPGMVDRGASMKDFSQYPHEVEVTWPPLTALSYVSSEVRLRGRVRGSGWGRGRGRGRGRG